MMLGRFFIKIAQIFLIRQKDDRQRRTFFKMACMVKHWKIFLSETTELRGAKRKPWVVSFRNCDWQVPNPFNNATSRKHSLTMYPVGKCIWTGVYETEKSHDSWETLVYFQCCRAGGSLFAGGHLGWSTDITFEGGTQWPLWHSLVLTGLDDLWMKS